MRIVPGLVMVAAAALGASTASAKTERLTDVAYIQAARCVGLATSKAMSQPDGEAMKAWLDAQGRGRQTFIVAKGEETQRQARRDADRADEFQKAKLSAELSGACAQLKG